VIVVLALAAAPAWAHGPRVFTPPIDPRDAAPSPMASTGPGEPASQTPGSERTLARPPAGRPTAGPVEATAVLIVALGLAGLARSWRRDRQAALAAVTAGVLLGFVVETTPHLVHHSLDADQGAGCHALQAAERNPAAVGAVDAAPVSTLASLDERPPLVSAPTPSAPASRGRAPPA
jgi:hypothetical protein